jgi:hypothetical protein
MRCLSISFMGGRPRRLPSLRALTRPARTLSWMMLRSKSANTDNMPNIALPLGVVVSMPCVFRNTCCGVRPRQTPISWEDQLLALQIRQRPISARSRANLTARARVRPGRRDLITCSKDKEAFDKVPRASRAATTSTSSAGRLLGPIAMRSSSSIALKRSIVAAFGSPATLLIFLTTARRSARSAALT